jgi:hypothetical protein
MKRLNWGLIGVVILCLAIVPLLGGCVPKSEYEALQAEHAALVQENTSLKAELVGVQSDLTSLQGDYDALNTDYQAASEELADIKEVYPPTYFDNYNELDSWVSEHCRLAQGAGTFRQHLDLQKMALADGYIWSVEYDRDSRYIISVVIAGDSVYWVWLDGLIEWIAYR